MISRTYCMKAKVWWKMEINEELNSKWLNWNVMYSQPEHIVCACPSTVLRRLQHEHLVKAHRRIIISLLIKEYTDRNYNKCKR